MAKSGKSFRANTTAPGRRMRSSPSSRIGDRGVGKYPRDTLGSARSVISRVQAYGTAAEKKAVYSAIRSRYPSAAATSTVIPTHGGSGRHYGQPAGSRDRSR